MTERCDPPHCVRVIGHDGECRPTWYEACGAWMPRAQVPCARRPGHNDAHWSGDAVTHRRTWFYRRYRVAA